MAGLEINRSLILVDASFLVAYYDAQDQYHAAAKQFLSTCLQQLVTTTACITEVMWLLDPHWPVQNQFLAALSHEVIRCEPLLTHDFIRIAALNQQYADLPGDFADLSLIVVSERLHIDAIATLDKDFDVYRRYRKDPFNRVFRP